MTRLRYVTLFAIAYVCSMCCTSGAAADDSIVVLHEPSLLSVGTRGDEGLVKQFRFGDRAGVGSGSWYYIRLRLQVSLHHEQSRGLTNIIAAVNGLTAGRVEVMRQATSECREMYVVKSLDLFKGFTKRKHCGNFVDVRFCNFLQTRSVRSGPARLSVFASGGSGARGSVKLLPGSGIYRTGRGPAHLEFGRPSGDGVLPVGKWSALSVALINRGDRPARKVTVGVLAPEGVAVKRRTIPFARTMDAGQRAVGRLWVKPELKGRFEVILMASSATSRAGVELGFGAGEKERRADGLQSIALGVAVAGLCALLLTWYRGRVSSGSLRPPGA